MRFQPWKQILHLRVQQTPLKFRKFFGVKSTFARFYKAAKLKSLEARKHQLEKRKTYASENRIIKRTKEERDKNEKIHAFVELSRQYDALRVEQMNLERQIKKRTTVLIKAVHRHKKSTKILGDIERTLINYSEQLKCAAIGHSLNDRTMETNYNNLYNSRTMGGSEAVTEYNADFMSALVKKFTAMRKYARRWMQKANIKKRHTSVDLATMIKIQQRMSWEPFRETISMAFKDPIKSLVAGEQYKQEISLRSQSFTSFPDTSAYRNEQKRTGSFKNLFPTSEAVGASEDNSKLAKRRKKLKAKQSATSDIDGYARGQRTGKRRSRGRRRSSRKSQQSITTDGHKKGQTRRKGRRKSIKSLDSTGQDMKQGERSQSARKGWKRQSKEKSKLSKISQESASHVGTLQSVKDENKTKQNLIIGVNLLQQMVSAPMKDGMADKVKDKGVELDKTQSDTNNQFQSLEEYWGVPLRENYTLRKLENLNSILDELIVEENEKALPSPSSAPPAAPASLHSKHVPSSRKVLPRPSKREMHDLEKLLIILQDCKKCQKKQEQMKTAEQDCNVLCQKEYFDAIRNAAGLPDYFPEDSDFSYICSCNSLT